MGGTLSELLRIENSPDIHLFETLEIREIELVVGSLSLILNGNIHIYNYYETKTLLGIFKLKFWLKQ